MVIGLSRGYPSIRSKRCNIVVHYDWGIRESGATVMANRFTRWLTDAMARADLNQTGLAALVGVTQSAVSHWLRGRSEPSDELIPRIARRLAVPVEDVYAALGRIPPQDAGEDEWMREIRARLDAATPEQRAQVAAVVRAMLERTERGERPCSGDTAEGVHESEP